MHSIEFNCNNMAKSNFDRYSLNNNILKQVIFRLDYKGVVNVVNLIEAFQSRFKNAFISLDNVFASQIDIELADIKDIGETLSIPLKELEKQEIYRFTNNTFGLDNNLTLDICKYFTTLSIDCNNYKTIDEYKDFFVNLVDFFLSNEEFISIKRFGLRKIAGDIFNNTDDIFANFEKQYISVSSELNQLNSIKSSYLDVISQNDGSIINYNRSIDTGTLIREDGVKTKAYQVVLDFNGYFDEADLNNFNIKSDPQNISNIINIINDRLFELFKMSVTEEFLKKSKDGKNKIE